MKNRIYKYSLLLLTLTTIVVGCKKQLEIEPRQSIPDETALSTPENIDASIVSFYSRLKNLRQYGRDLITHPEALADNGYATNKSGRLLPESNNNFNSHFTGTIWQNSYAAINQINLTLEAIPSLEVVPAPSPARVASWEGQMYFLRALYYFDMVRVYAYIPGAVVTAQDRGGVPIMLRGVKNLDSALAIFPSRPPIIDNYNQIISDLLLAESKLTYSSTTDVALANQAAARLLAARVYLYMKQYDKAKEMADKVIAQAASRMTNTSDYVAQWRAATNNETLFQVRFAQNNENPGVNESLQTSFTTLVTPGNTAVTGGFGDLVPSISLLNDLGITLTGGNTNTVFLAGNKTIESRSSDIRNLLYEVGTSGRGTNFVETTKYLGKNGFINLDNIPVLRISEAYLIRAEAQATTGSPVFNEAAALADLKFLKSRRYVGYTGSAIETADNALTGSALFEEILRQRRIELAFEGHRFFDLKRLGRDIVKSAPSTAVVAFTDPRILAPIPLRETDGNKNLQQNFGY